MFRVLAIAIAVTVAVPAAGGIACADVAADLMGPESCCCPIRSDAPTAPQVEPVCCCELSPVERPIEQHETPAVLAADVSVPHPVVAIAVDPYPPGPPARAIEGLALARGPPASSLLSQSTALLL